MINKKNINLINLNKLKYFTFADLNFLLQKLYQIILIQYHQSNQNNCQGSDSLVNSNSHEIALNVNLNKILELFVTSCSEESLEEFFQWENEIKHKKKYNNII